MSLYVDLSPKERELLRQEMPGSIVFDFGCGRGDLSILARELGASRVVGIDARTPCPQQVPRGVRFENKYFLHLVPTLAARLRRLTRRHEARQTVAIVSWPEAMCSGLDNLVLHFDRVLYRGINTGGFVCGSRDLWRVLLRREPVAYISDPGSTTILYDRRRRGEQTVFHEELAAVHRWRPDLDITHYSPTLKRFKLTEADKIAFGSFDLNEVLSRIESTSGSMSLAL